MWWTCLNESFIMNWLIMLFRSTGSNSGMVVKTWIKLPIQCKEVDQSFCYTNVKPVHHCILFFSTYLLFSLKQWAYELHKKLSWVKESIRYEFHWVYHYCNGFYVNLHNRMRGNWCIFLLVCNKTVFMLWRSVISSN